MKFGILTQWFDPETGPAAIPTTVARELANRGHQIHVITGFPNYPRGKLYPGYRLSLRKDSCPQDHVQIRRVPLYPSHDSSATRRALNYMSFGLSAASLGGSVFRNLDAIWVYNSPATVAIAMWRAAYLYRTPVVLHIMDLWPDSLLLSGLPDMREGSFGYRAIGKWCQGMYKSSAVIACTSPGIGLELQERGVDEQKLRYAPLWADETFESIGAQSPVANRDSEDSVITILYAGALGWAQGLRAFLQGLRLAQDHVPMRLKIAGSGPASKEILGLVPAFGLSEVEYLGQLSTEELVKPMQQADIHLVTLRASPLSRMTIPSKIFNTLALAKPFIACLEGDALELALASHAAIPATPDDPDSIADALMQAAALGKRRLGEMGRDGRNFYLDNFSIASGISRIESALHHAAATAC